MPIDGVAPAVPVDLEGIGTAGRVSHAIEDWFVAHALAAALQASRAAIIGKPEKGLGSKADVSEERVGSGSNRWSFRYFGTVAARAIGEVLQAALFASLLAIENFEHGDLLGGEGRIFDVLKFDRVAKLALGTPLQRANAYCCCPSTWIDL